MRATASEADGTVRTTTVGLVVETLDVASNGAARLRLRFESFDVSPLDGRMRSLLPRLREAFGRAAVEFTESPVGEIVVADSPAPNDVFDVPPRAFADNVFTTMPRLPDNSVRPSDRWTSHFATHIRASQMNSDTAFDRTYTLARISGRRESAIAEIDVDESSEAQSSMALAGHGDGRGSIRFDAATGELVESRISGTFTVRAGAIDMSPSHHEFAPMADE